MNKPNVGSVLQLDGDGDYIRLPSGIFNHLEEATVEAWVKWQRLGPFSQPFGFGKMWQVMGVHNGFDAQDIVFFIYLQAQQLHVITLSKVLQIDQWYHIAAVSGTCGMKLYLNGVLAGERDFKGSFAAIGNGEQNYFGQSHWPENTSFYGQLAEIRVWDCARSEEQIRRSLHQQLAGDEAHLVGLWNFAESDARDASPNGYDGEFLGAARCLSGRPPAADVLDQPGVLYGQIVDDAGHPLSQAAVRLEREGATVLETEADTSGRYQLVVWLPRQGVPSERGREYYISATHTELGSWSRALRLQPGESWQVDLSLQEAVSIEGTLLAPDNTPHRNVTIQALGSIGDDPVPRPRAKTQCDPGGRYRFINLQPGSYRLRCQVGDGYAYYRPVAAPEGEILQIETGHTLKAIDFRFPSFRRGIWRHYTSIDGLVHNTVWAIHRDADGMLWLGTEGGGVSRYDGESFTSFTTEDGLAHNVVRAICRDTTGAIWFSTLGGVSRCDGEVFTVFTSKDGLVHNKIFAIHCDAEGVLWLGSGGGLSRFDGESFVNFTTEDGLVHNTVDAIHCDAEGVLWLGTEDGLSRFDGESFVNFTTEDGLAHNRIFAIHCDAEGILWLGTDAGLSRFDERRLVNFTSKDGLADTVWTIHGETDGTLWFGTAGGVSRFDGQTFTNFTTKDGLVDNQVRVIDRTPAGLLCGTHRGICLYDADGALWLGTEGGVSRYDGREFTNFTAADGLAHNDVRAICCDGDGMVWFSTLGGAVSYFDGVAWASLDRRDGLMGNLIRAVRQGADGAMWFGTDRGATRYRRCAANPPVVCIAALQTDVRQTDLDTLKPLVVGTRTTIEYTSIDFKTLPEKRQYRCRVASADLAAPLEQTAWSVPTRSDRFEWTPRQEGAYLFEVQAIDQDLNYSPPARLALEVVPQPQLEALRRTRRELEAAYRTLAAKNEELEAQSTELQAAKERAEEAGEVAEEARVVAEEANRAKSIFLANMSHEIRTPMNAILGYTQNLLRDPQLGTAQRGAVETVERSGQHLLSLIDEVLDISRIEAGRHEVQESDFDLKTLVRELGVMFELRCSQKGLGWHLEEEMGPEAALVVRGDEGKLRQVLSNLLSNAVKFTPSGVVVLRVSQAIAARSMCFEVVDTGPGLDPGEHQRIFEPFQQEQTDSAQEGAGLGLAIAVWSS